MFENKYSSSALAVSRTDSGDLGAAPMAWDSISAARAGREIIGMRSCSDQSSGAESWSA